VYAAIGSALAVLIVLGAVGVVGWSYYGRARLVEYRITSEMTAGQTDLEKAKSLLGQAASNRSTAQIDQSRALNAQARAHFTAAKQIAATDPLIKQALGLPYAGPYVRPRLQAVASLADMGLAVSDTLTDGADLDTRLIKTDDVPGSGGAKLLTILRDAQPLIDKLQQDLARAKSAVDLVDPAVLTGSQVKSLDSARDTIVKGLAGAVQLKALIPVLFEIMGANGARTYLVEQVNPAELRAGGGFIGSYAVIQTDKGNIRKIKSGGVEAIDTVRPTRGQRGYTAPPATMQEFLGDKSWYFGDSNFFPDFPTNARWGETFAEKQLGVKADGVLSLDPTAVAYLLEVTGPITIPDYGVTVQAQDFVDFLFRYENGPNRPAGRKLLLGVVADALLDKVANLPPTAWPQLIGALNKAGQERHFQAYFNNQTAQAQMSQYRWANDLNPGQGADWLLETESNFGGTKANHFVTRSYDLTLTRDPNSVHHKLVVTLAEDLNAPVVPEGENYYRAYARLYVSGNAANMAVGDLKADRYPNTDLPPGTKLGDGWLQVNPVLKTKKGTYTMTFEYDTPWAPNASGSEVLYWQKQPGTDPDAISVTYQVNGQTFKAASKLTTDQQVAYGDHGVSIAAAESVAATLPSISL